jgi:hypothetical protein
MLFMNSSLPNVKSELLFLISGIKIILKLLISVKLIFVINPLLLREPFIMKSASLAVASERYVSRPEEGFD